MFMAPTHCPGIHRTHSRQLLRCRVSSGVSREQSEEEDQSEEIGEEETTEEEEEEETIQRKGEKIAFF